MCNRSPASVRIAYAIWFFFGLFGGHRFYVGRPVSGLVWLCTFGLFGVGWVIDLFLLPEFVEEHNKKVFHQQMLETGTTLLFDGEYGQSAPYYPTQATPAFGNQAPYASHVYYPQPQAGGGKGGAYDGSYY